MSERQYLTTREAAEYLTLSKETLALDRAKRTLNIPFATLGRRILYRREDLDAYVESKLTK